MRGFKKLFRLIVGGDGMGVQTEPFKFTLIGGSEQ